MADISKMVTKLANSSAGHQLVTQVARDPQKALAGIGAAVTTAAPVVVEVAVAAAPIVAVAAVGYGAYRLAKWVFE